MTNDPTEPVAPYTPPAQWTRRDLDVALEVGDHARITAAQNAGQLADLLAAPTGDDPSRQTIHSIDDLKEKS